MQRALGRASQARPARSSIRYGPFQFFGVGFSAMADIGIPAGVAAPRRGRPRSEQADRAILQAAAELLAERGLHGMSIEEVASRAGVAKATVYRRWPSRGALALDAFLAEFTELQPLPDTGFLRDDLLADRKSVV